MRLTEYSHGSGWACKLSQGELAQVLKQLKQQKIDNPNVIVGLDSPDDGGVIKIGENIQLIQTVDFFTPILDDPYDWGRVAAANALSDVYAMGGYPISALQLISWPRSDIGFDILSKVIEGGAKVMKDAGCNIIGGHSIDDKEPKYGFAVTGIIEGKIYTKTNLQKGQRLILTKPLGSGIIATAIKKGIADSASIEEITEVMTTLNHNALSVAKELQAEAITDITGFGLLGHLSEMLIDEELSATILLNRVPILSSAKKYFNKGIYPSGSQRNLDSILNQISFDNLSLDEIKYLADAQTSGGLLFSIASDSMFNVEDIKKNYNVDLWEIGEITSRYNKKINIINN